MIRKPLELTPRVPKVCNAVIARNGAFFDETKFDKMFQLKIINTSVLSNLVDFFLLLYKLLQYALANVMLYCYTVLSSVSDRLFLYIYIYRF